MNKPDLEQLDKEFKESTTQQEEQQTRQRRSIMDKFKNEPEVKKKAKTGPKKRLKETKLQTFNIEVELLDRMDSFYDITGVSKSEFVRQAIKEKLKKEGY